MPAEGGAALKRLLDIALITIFVLSVAALFLVHEGPFKTLYDLAVGALTSLLFYLLVVRLPDYQRRQRLKGGLERHYRDFRKDCIEIMLLVADRGYSGGVSETLIEQDKFKGIVSCALLPAR